MSVYTLAKSSSSSSSSACSPQQWCHSHPHIHRSACQARSAFTRLNSFLSLSLHHYASTSLLWHRPFSIHVSFPLFFSSSLYHLLVLFSPVSAPVLDLISPSLLMFLLPAGFWGVGVLLTMSVFQADFLALLSQCETQALLLALSLWLSPPLWSVPLITGNSAWCPVCYSVT